MVAYRARRIGVPGYAISPTALAGSEPATLVGVLKPGRSLSSGSAWLRLGRVMSETREMTIPLSVRSGNCAPKFQRGIETDEDDEKIETMTSN